MPGPRVLVLSSEHGRGHHARMLVLAEALAMEGAEVRVTEAAARTRAPGAGVQAVPAPALDFGARVWQAQASGNLVPELARLVAEVPARVAAWEAVLARERAQLVVVDADPEPLVAAAAREVPGVVVSNFAWSDFLAAWAEPRAGGWVAGLYSAAAGGLELPWSLPLRGVPAPRADIPHLAWPPAAPPAPAPGEGPLRAVLALGFGHPQAPRRVAAAEPTELLVPADAPAPEAGANVRLRPLQGNVADALPGMDLVVTKGGYSTVAEAVAHARPLLLVPRPDSPEDEAIIAGVAQAGAGRRAALEGGVLWLPGRSEVTKWAEAYARPGPWSACDPRGVARLLLEAAGLG